MAASICYLRRIELSNPQTKKKKNTKISIYEKIKSNRILLCVFVYGASHVFCIRHYLCTGPINVKSNCNLIQRYGRRATHSLTHSLDANQSNIACGALGILWKHFRPQSNFIFATLNGLAIDFHVDFIFIVVAAFLCTTVSTQVRPIVGEKNDVLVSTSSIPSIHIQFSNCIHKLTASNHNMNGRLIDAIHSHRLSHWTFTW